MHKFWGPFFIGLAIFALLWFCTFKNSGYLLLGSNKYIWTQTNVFGYTRTIK